MRSRPATVAGRLRDGYGNGLVLIDAQLRRRQPTEDVDSNRSRVGESMPSIVETLIFSIAPWNWCERSLHLAHHLADAKHRRPEGQQRK